MIFTKCHACLESRRHCCSYSKMFRLAFLLCLVAYCSAVTTNCAPGQVCPVVVTARTDPATGNCSANASTIRSQIVSGLSSQLSGVSTNLTTALNNKYLGLTAATAAQTCLQIKQVRPSATSGNYWILKSSTPVQVYCEMSLVCSTSSGCNSFAGGWLQVAKINMTNTSQTCPVGVGNAGLFTVDVTNNIRSCRRTSTAGSAEECNLGFLEVLGGLPYQEVCGRVLGYQWGSPDGLTVTRSLNQAYTDGISLTSTPDPAVDSNWWQNRIHLWSYIAHFSEDTTSGCPCCTGYTGGAVPSFMGNNYYCESGLQLGSNYVSGTDPLYSNDALWDSMQCGNLEAPCCNGPWFCNKLASSTSNRFLEVRICCDESAITNEDVSLQILELYVR